MNDKKLLIFDLDGTLIDSVPDLANALNVTLAEEGMPTLPVETIRNFVGNGALTLVKRGLSGSVEVNPDLDEARVQAVLERFLEHYTKGLCIDTVLFEGVEDTLVDLYRRGYILTIVTNKPYAFIEPLLQALDINNYFTDLLGADSLSKKKPDPMPLLHLCDKHDIRVEEAVMIGDSKNDMQAAAQAGMDSIAVTYGYNYDEDISVYNPTHIIRTFDELKGVLRG